MPFLATNCQACFLWKLFLGYIMQPYPIKRWEVMNCTVNLNDDQSQFLSFLFLFEFKLCLYLSTQNSKIQQECSSLDTKRRARQSQHYRTSVTWEAQCLENQHTTAELLTSLSLRGLSRAVCPSELLHSSHSNRQGILHKLSLYSWVNLLLLTWTCIHWFTFADNLFGQQIIRMQFNSVTSNI